MASTRVAPAMRESRAAPDDVVAPDPFEAYRPRLVVWLGIGAALALVVGGSTVAMERQLGSIEWIGFGTALALFCSAPLVLRWTGSVLAGAVLLMSGGAISIFVPAYFSGGLQSPQVIWLLVIPILCPLYFGSRVTFLAGMVSLAAFCVLYLLEITDRLPLALSDGTDFTSFVNLVIAVVFVLLVSTSTHRVMRRSHRDLLELQDDLERRSEELAASESRKSAIIDSAVTGLISADADDRILDCNPAACSLLGFSRDEVIGCTIAEIMVPRSTREFYRAAYQAALATPAHEVRAQPRELVALCKNGTQVPVEVTLQRVAGEGPAVFMAQVRDLSAQRHAEALVRRREQQLQRSQRLEGVGRLAGGVAHDFNNLLTVIGGYSESIGEDPDGSASIRNQAREISRASDRAASITRQMLAFSRGQNLSLTAVDLHALLLDLEVTIGTLVPARITLELNLLPAPWPVRANRTELERSVVNLVTNAVHAMPDGGRLSIHTEYLDFERLSRELPLDLEPGRYAMLCVADDGEGMTAAVRESAFEPFFTTKEIGKGTGLGLASVYGVVRQCGGHVELVSSPGIGTRVEVYLPMSDSKPGSVDSERTAPLQSLPTNFVLVVEDESGIRNLVSARLRREGYRVVEAADAEEALELTSLEGDEIALLISDVVMPNRSGASLASELREARPDLPVIFMSGFAGEEFSDLTRDFPGAEFVAKPLRMESLVGLVRRLVSPTETQAEAQARGI